MELVYDKRLVHYLGSDELENNGKSILDFSFRDGSGEKFNIQLEQNNVPNTFFACTDVALEKALQAILDQHSTVPIKR